MDRVKCWLTIPHVWDIVENRVESILSYYRTDWLVEKLVDTYLTFSHHNEVPLDYLISASQVDSVFFLPDEETRNDLEQAVAQSLLDLYIEFAELMDMYCPDLKHALMDSRRSFLDYLAPRTDGSDLSLCVMVTA